jgi:hypothetical protein
MSSAKGAASQDAIAEPMLSEHGGPSALTADKLLFFERVLFVGFLVGMVFSRFEESVVSWVD